MNLKSHKKSQHIVQVKALNDLSPTSNEKKSASQHVLVDVSCPICQEPVGRPTPDKVVESWSLLPCGHKFGSICIKHWLGLVAEEKPCCPVCRKNATFVCGHPVLPKVITADQARRHDGMRGPDWSAVLQHTPCEYCRLMPTRIQNQAAVKGGRLKGLAKGCWRIVSLGWGRRRIQGRVVRVDVEADWRREAERRYTWMSPMGCVDCRNDEWLRWWDNQEPKNA